MIRIAIVVEDASDGRALKAIIERLLEPARVQVRYFPARGRSEVGRKAGALIEVAAKHAPCVLVIVDLDGDDPAGHAQLQRIRQACATAPVRARMVGVAQEIEAWFLADAAAVLARAGAPGGYTVNRWTDVIGDPKRELSTILRRLRGRGYTAARDAERLARDLDPEEAARWNQSFADFATLVRSCSGRGEAG
jgi:hypothetical protein